MGTFSALPALNVQRAPDPLEEVGRVLGIKGMIQQQQENQIKLQTSQIGLDDVRATTAAMREWDGKDVNDLYPLVMKHGGSSSAVIGLKNQLIGQQEKLSAIGKNDAEAGKNRIETMQKDNDTLLGHLHALPDPQDPTYVDSLNRELAAARNGGYIDPAHAQQIENLAATKDPTKIAPALDLIEKGLMTRSQQFEQAAKERELRAKEVDVLPDLGIVYDKNDGSMKHLLTGETMTPKMMEMRYIELGQKERLGTPLTKEEKAFRSSYQNFLLTKPMFQLQMGISGGGLGYGAGAPGAAGGAPAPVGTPAPAGGGETPASSAAKQAAPGGWIAPNGKTLNDVPQLIRDEVKQVLEYRRADPSITQRGQVGQAINSWVAALDPLHDTTTFPAKNRIVQDNIKSMNDGTLSAVNTALGHLEELHQASKALYDGPGGNIPLLHAIAESVGAKIGKDAPTTYQEILNKVGPELTKAYLKSGGTVGERGSNEDDFALAKGQKQITSNIAEAVQLLGSKIEPLRQNWNSTFQPYRPDKSDSFDTRWLTPRAKNVIAELASQAPTNISRGGEAAAPAPRKTYKQFLDEQKQKE